MRCRRPRRANFSVVAPQPQPTSSTRSPERGAAKASNASVTGAKVIVGVLLSRHSSVAARPVPEGELIGVELLGVGHASPPVRSELLVWANGLGQLCMQCSIQLDRIRAQQPHQDAGGMPRLPDFYQRLLVPGLHEPT